MQKVKNLLSGNDDTSSSRTSGQGYDTSDNFGHGQGAERSRIEAERQGLSHGSHGTSSNRDSIGSTGLTGNGSSGTNVHSGSTGVGSNIGRETSEISGGQGLGNAATAAGSNYGSAGHSSGLTGDRYTGESTGHSGLTSGTSGQNSSGTGSSIVNKLTGNHSLGHDSRDTTKFDPTGENTHHDHKHLQAVTHATHRHQEVEEVERIRDHQRHVHHLQHHVQPVKDTRIQDEVHHNTVHPVTNISERHVNTDEDVKLFQGLGEKHRDEERHLAKERTVVDLGEKVNTTTHHHVHHVTQPVVEQEIHDRHRIHTQIPLTHTVHEAPIIHKSSVHEPVHISDFLKGGGKLDSGIRHNESGILATGDCDRSVDGVGEKLASELNLKPSTFGHSGTTSTGSLGQSGTSSHGLGSHGDSRVSGTGSTGLSSTGDRLSGGERLSGNGSSPSRTGL